MHIPSQLDENRDLIQRLVSEQLKENAQIYNIATNTAWNDQAPHYAYDHSGLDEVIGRDLTKKERLYRGEAFQRVKDFYFLDGGDPLSFMDTDTQAVIKQVKPQLSILNLDSLDVASRELLPLITSRFDTLALIDILDVGESQ